ncbi:radical SAM protein, partial [Desulfobotulus sp. H1]
MVIPEHLQIEIVAGICSADCIMCTIKDTPRKGILSINDYASILKKFEPYTDKLQYLTLHGMGEPLLDKTLPAKIALAKKKGFKGIGFATNATHLTRDKTEALLDCGLNTIIFSLDGITKKTHENIRRGVDYDDIMEKILYFIKRRNQQNALDTKIIVRMIRQESNQHECDDYRTFWNGHLSPANGDLV